QAVGCLGIRVDSVGAGGRLGQAPAGGERRATLAGTGVAVFARLPERVFAVVVLGALGRVHAGVPRHHTAPERAHLLSAAAGVAAHRGFGAARTGQTGLVFGALVDARIVRILGVAARPRVGRCARPLGLLDIARPEPDRVTGELAA